MANSTGARGLAERFIVFGAQDLHPAEQSAAENLRFNLVCVYMSTGRHASALPILEQLLDAAPEDMRFQRAMAQCYLAVGRLDDAEKLFAR
jgi:Tfp pilus assembly protein PilF